MHVKRFDGTNPQCFVPHMTYHTGRALSTRLLFTRPVRHQSQRVHNLMIYERPKRVVLLE